MESISVDPEFAVDRDPVLGRHLPYSPAEGEVVELNPPPFRWLPSGADVTYRLQVSPDDAFQGERTVALEGLDWCCEMLTEELSPGAWHWRYGVDRLGAETEWSKSRCFEVTKYATSWPYPGRDSFQVPRERPRLFFTRKRLADFRQRAADGDLKVAAASIVRSTQRHIDEELLPEPEFLPQGSDERREAYDLIFLNTRPSMDVMEQAALAYLLTGDRDCGNEARRRLLHFFSWDPSGSTGVFHNDEPAMWIMMRGSRAYDWTYDLLTPEERELVEASIRIRAADFYKKLRSRPYENNPYESHAGRIIGFLGEVALSFLPKWPEAREWLDYISKIYWGVYPAWGKDDGGWNEGPAYWSAYMSFALHFVVALKEATGVDLAQRPFFRNTPYYTLYVVPPRTQMAPFGDGNQFKPGRPGALMYWFSTLTRNAAFRWYAEEAGHGPGNTALGIALTDTSLQAKPPTDLPTSRLFEGVGLACLHTDLVNGDEDVAFLMRSSPFGAVSHSHNDQNCFTLQAYGEALAIATGYYNSYGSPHHDRWTRQTKAKCGITFDGGQAQERGWHAQGKITDFQHCNHFDLVVGDATEAYGGKLTRAVREVVFVRPDAIVIRDCLASHEPRLFEFHLHALDEMAVDHDTATVVTTRPRATLTTRFLWPTGIEISQTDKFDPPPLCPLNSEFANNWHLTASLTTPAKETELLTVLMPAKAGAEGALPTVRAIESNTASGVELAYPDGSRTIVGFAKPGVTGEVTLAEIATNSRIFATSYLANGMPAAALRKR